MLAHMLAQQHHLYLPRNKQVQHAFPQPPFLGPTPSRQFTCQSRPCDAYQYACLSHTGTSLSATAEQASSATSEVPSEWREPLNPMLWHVSSFELGTMTQTSCEASPWPHFSAWGRVCSWVRACRAVKVKLESVSQQIWHLLGRLVIVHQA